MRYNYVTIKGTGSYLPPTVVSNAEITKNVDTTEEWIFSKLGIKERRVAKEETTAQMGYKAAVNALRNANLTIDDIDLIIVATSSPEHIAPSTACTIHNQFGTSRDIPAIDMNAVCAGFVYAMTFAMPMISMGACNNVLIIGTEAYSKMTDWTKQHCVFFGDGAGAMVLGNSTSGWAVSTLSANGSGTGMTGFRCYYPTPFEMQGKQVWDQAIKVLPPSITRALTEAQLQADDVKMLIPHQPSINILKIVAKEVGLPMEKVKTVMDRYGNIACASIPVALDEAVQNGEVGDGDQLVLSSIGSGWAWGSLTIQYKR